MRAYVLQDFSTPAALIDISEPQAGPGEVRIRVTSSSVNPADAATAAGFFRAMSEHRLPAVLGRDLAGTVDQVGDSVGGFAPGDEVFGMVKRPYVGGGTFADYVVVPAERYIVRRPERLDVADAGALGLVGVTALQCLEALACSAGDTILINGATGGVGAIAIQLAVALDLTVIATARPGAEEAHVRALGAEETVDWGTAEMSEAVRRLRPDGVQGVIDLVSRDADTFRGQAGLTEAGRTAVSTLGAAPADLAGTASNVHSDGDPALLERLAASVVSGAVRVPLVNSVGFDRIDHAFELLRAAPLGKIGLLMHE